MRILVTGGAGFIGAHACKALAAAGHTPIAYDNLRTGHRWAVRFGPFEHGDILDTPCLIQVLRTHRIDAVMHFAALAYVGESALIPDAYYRTNVVGTLSVLDAMRAAGVGTIVLSSSCATFGNAAGRIDDSVPQNPINPYGATKLAAEWLIRDHARAHGIAAVALRYFNAAGADPDGEIGEVHDPETHLIPIALQVAAGRRSRIEVFGLDYETPDGSCVRDYIHVSDLADAHIAALGHAQSGRFAAFNLGNGAGYSVREVISLTERVTGRPVPWIAAARRDGDPASLIADASAAERVLGWRPKRPSLEAMITDAWRFMNDRQYADE